MGVRLDDAALIKALRTCSTLGRMCEDCPMYDSDPSNSEDSLGCFNKIELLAANRLEALISGTTDIPTFVKWVRTNLIHFEEPMRIPTVTQQEHDLAVNRRTGKPYVHDNMELKQARMSFRAHLYQHIPPEPFTGALSLSVTWLFLDNGMNHKDLEYKTTRPDTDNMIKMLKDEMAHCGFMKNDAQVAVEVNRKIWSRTFEGIIVDVAALPEVAVL